MREIDVLKTKQEQSQQAGTRFSFGREQLFTGVRPRLLRLARLRGVAPDALEDVVQESLLLAWRLLDRLDTPEHFYLWVEEICRAVPRIEIRPGISRCWLCPFLTSLMLLKTGFWAIIWR